MTKAELIERIARSHRLAPDVTKKTIQQIIELAFAELGQYFLQDHGSQNQNPRFTFPGFGTFTKKHRKARKGVHPRTLKPMEIAAHTTVDFKPSCELRRMLNEDHEKLASLDSLAWTETYEPKLDLLPAAPLQRVRIELRKANQAP